jgi:hypothetical protein
MGERWSLTKLGTYEQCPAKYKYKYIEKLPEVAGFAASRGTILHDAIEGFINSKLDKLPQEISFYTDFFSNLRAVGGKTEHTILLDEMWKPVENKADAWFSGVLDFIIFSSPTVTLYDWKTGRQYDEHYQQKEIYSIAALQSHPDAVEARAIHVYVDKRQNTERIYHRDTVPARIEQWERRVDKMFKAQEFIPNPQFLCSYCHYSKAKGGPCRF